MGAQLQGGKHIVEAEKKGLLESHNLGALWHECYTLYKC